MRVANLHTEEGVFIAIISKPGRKFTKYVAIMGYPLRLRKMSNAEAARYTSEQNYHLKKAAVAMMGVGRRHGITKSAREFLKRARQLCSVEEPK